MATYYVATTGNDTTGTGTSGNPYATPGKAGSVIAAGDTIFIKSGTYTLTTSTVNVAGGPLKITFTNEGSITYVIGYDTNAAIDNTDANRPTISAGSISSIVVIECSGYGCDIRNIIVDGNSQTSITGFYNSGGYDCPFINCKAANCTSYGFRGSATLVLSLAILCEASGCSGTASFDSINCVCCAAHGGTCTGFNWGSAGDRTLSFHDCVSYSNTGASSDGFHIGAAGVGGPATLVNCTAYGNGRHGFFADDYSRNSAMTSCLATGNGGYGFKVSATGGNVVHLRNCAGYNNTSGNTSLPAAVQSMGFVTLSGNPFTNAAGGNFSLNNTAGAGAACRAAGIPGVLPGGVTTGYLDIGAIQHADPAAGGPASKGILSGGRM